MKKRIEIAQMLALAVRDADIVEIVIDDANTVTLTLTTWKRLVDLAEQFRSATD